MSYIDKKNIKTIIEVDTTTYELPIRDLPWIIENSSKIKIHEGSMTIFNPSEELIEELENRGVKFRYIKGGEV